MIRITMTAAVAVVGMLALVSSAQIVAPTGSVQNFSDIEAREVRDGIFVQGIVGDTVRFTRIEAVKGARSAEHNHANEQFVALQSGSLRAYAGDDEYVLVPGDVAVFPAWVPHNLIALEDSVWLEIHGPGF